MPSCVYTDPELASLGLNEKRARERGIECTVHTAEFSANDRALAEGEGRGRIKLLLDRKEHPVGVQILGPSAGELLGEWIAALNGKVGLSTLAQAVHPYPTLGEIAKAVAGDVVGRKLFSGTVRTGLGLLFQYKGRACGED
jgi:pyruvate/2-oxoglutarate dehydrogenase complex dihydrolipoamide dehydrogenase (E3) component